MRKFLILLLAILYSAITGGVMAQSAGFILIPPDARTFSMGGSSVGIVSNAYGFFNNSASLVFSQDKGALSASYSSWLPGTADKTVISGTGFLKLSKKSVLSIGYSNITHQEIILTGPTGSSMGSFTPKEFLAGLGFSYKIGETLSASANLKLISSDIGGSSSASAFAADLNLFYKKENITLGLSASNLGSSLDYGQSSYSLPANAKLGAGINTMISQNSSLLFSAYAGMVFNQSAFIAGAGVEYSYKNMLFLRAGGHYGDEEKSTPPYLGIGAGVKVFGLLNLDAAYLLGKSDSPINNSLNISLGFNF